MGLIKNAITQGIRAVEHVAAQALSSSNGAYDVIIVGAGPGGLASALAAKRNRLKSLVLEQDDIGGTILQYPRRKIVMTSPVELPLYGKIKLTETTKESLLDLWNRIIQKMQLRININEKVIDVQRRDGAFAVSTSKGEYLGKSIILALGRRGTPRKLGVDGEGLSKVTYRLIEAETYQNCHILIVGGGDSAVEAAIALGAQETNQVTISYRKAEFTRIKDRNTKHLEDSVRRGCIRVVFNSNVREISQESVLLETQEGSQEIRNDYVFVFAGGELPYDFLRKIGVHLYSQTVQ